jgi:RNA polymerase sigma factor (sigma-70 family)
MATSPMSEVLQHLRSVVLLRDGAGLTDGQLLEDYLSRRDESALAALVRRHGPMVWGVCRRILPNYHDAEDAFQATFLVFVRKAGSIASRELLANWLYGVAHQTALKARATAAKRKKREKQVTKMPEPAVTEQDLWRDLQPLLDEELSRLPDKYRAVIVLCELEGKTRKEAARQLGVPEGTVAGQLARARTMLAKRLARHGLAVSGGVLGVVLAQTAASACVPAPVVSTTIQTASLVASGQTAAGVISAQVAALTERVMKHMLLMKLKTAMVVLLVVGMVAFGAGLLTHPLRATAQQGQTDDPEARAKQVGRDAPKKEAKKDPRKGQKELKEGTLLAQLEKVDTKERTITVTRLGTPLWGIGDPERGGLAGAFTKNIRLENVPVASTARILVNGKKGKLADLKPGMLLSLQLVVKGSITVQEITAQSK